MYREAAVPCVAVRSIRSQVPRVWIYGSRDDCGTARRSTISDDGVRAKTGRTLRERRVVDRRMSEEQITIALAVAFGFCVGAMVASSLWMLWILAR